MEATVLCNQTYTLTCTCTAYHPYGQSVLGEGNPFEKLEVVVEEGCTHLALIQMVPIKVTDTTTSFISWHPIGHKARTFPFPGIPLVTKQEYTRYRSISRPAICQIKAL